LGEVNRFPDIAVATQAVDLEEILFFFRLGEHDHRNKFGPFILLNAIACYHNFILNVVVTQRAERECLVVGTSPTSMIIFFNVSASYWMPGQGVRTGGSICVFILRVRDMPPADGSTWLSPNGSFLPS
jgi:hypothetical protein